MTADTDPAVAEPVVWAITLNGRLRATLMVDEVAELMGISAARVRELIRGGRIKTVQVRTGSTNTRYLVPVGPFLTFLHTFDDPAPSQ